MATDTQNSAVRIARSLIGAPWDPKGRGKRAIGCGGVCFYVGRKVGAFHSRSHTTGYNWATIEGIWGPWPGVTRIVQRDKQPGDLLVMAKTAKTPKDNLPYYSGIIGEQDGELTLIHQLPGKNVSERKLSEIMAGRPLKGVVYRFEAERAERIEGRPDNPDTDPEVITP